MSIFNPKYFFNLENYNHSELFNNCDYVWDALNNIKEYLGNYNYLNNNHSFEGAFFVNLESIYIGKNTVIEPGAYIKGPVIIGDNCIVRHGAYIRGGVITGNDCIIGHSTEIKNTIMLNGAKAAHFNYLGDSILGNGVNLGAGTKLANLKFNGKTIHIDCEGNLIDSGLRKFGAILGDDSQTGCNSVTNPGTVIGRRCVVYPNQTVKGVVLQDEEYRA